MFTLFSVTEFLFEKIADVLEAVFGIFSSTVGAVALVCCVVLVINILDSKLNKKFFVNNRKYILITLALEALSCLISPTNELTKFNFLIIIASLTIILFKLTKTKKETKRTGTKNAKSI